MRRLLAICLFGLLASCGDKPDVAQLVGDLTWTTFTAIIEGGLGPVEQSVPCPDGGTIAVDLLGIDAQGRIPVIYTGCADRGYVFDGMIKSTLGSNLDVYTLKYSGDVAISGKEACELAFTDLEEVVSFETSGMSTFTMKLTGKVDATADGELFERVFDGKLYRYDKATHDVSEM